MENLNGLDLLGVISAATGAILYIGNAIVKATPTEKDDDIFDVVSKVSKFTLKVTTFFMKSRKKGGGFHE